ncbi:MAG: glycoside hydrolase family 99-like domain-containing protein [Coleofasciculus sp. B1-GNL1-01]|uniref:glycosyltransferase WbsX family protein n=1 Tax=Coleofasciculus sp. B1-GNL1-01 TaxID=3068484 RepID=UPI0032FAA319
MTTNPLKSAKARLIAFYLPQFHPIPENDQAWGKGFTEWTNVAKAKPLFPGHDQPKIPADLGFYDLRVPEARQAQAELAREYGIEGFCYWHYWFAGKRVLERPFNQVLKSGEPNFPFCLAWANQTWTGIWHGCPDRVLIEQTYPGLADYTTHFYTLLEAFTDPRYITVEGKPLFLVYNPEELPDPKQFTDCWRDLAIKSGLKGLYLIGVARHEYWFPESNGFDASIVINPDYVFTQASARIFPGKRSLTKVKQRFSAFSSRRFYQKYKQFSDYPLLYSYEKAIKCAFKGSHPYFVTYPCIFPNWDNTPRTGIYGLVFLKSTPDLFRVHLQEAIETVSERESEKRLIFIRSWNEWAEGNYLEPDLKFGKAFLEVIRDEIYS